MRVSGLYTYPVKSIRGISHQSRALTLRGLHGDRSLMVVDDENHFMTQREISDLAIIEASDENGTTWLHVSDSAPIPVVFDETPKRVNTIVWRDTVHVPEADAATNEALSDALGKRVKIVAMDEQSVRTADKDFAGESTPITFADGYPVLATTQQSLDALNDKIVELGDEPVPMSRFRANIVLDEAEAWEEDTWLVVRIGDVIFDAVKPCDRCIMTTKNQETGRMDESNQPVRAMIKFRKSGDKRVNGVLFGWNLVPRSEGHLTIGDTAEVLEHRDRWPISLSMR